MLGRRSRFVSNTAALGTSTVLTTVFTLVQVKILAAYLPPEQFGSFAALRGFSLLLSSLATNGFPLLLIRYLPFHESRRQTSAALVLSGVCLLAPLFLLTVIVFGVESNRTFFFHFMSGGVAPAGLFLWFYATTLGVTLKLVLYGGFNGLRRLPVQVVLELSSLAVQVAWIYVWRDQLSLTRLFMILAVTSLGACVAGLPWYFARLSLDTSPSRSAEKLGFRAAPGTAGDGERGDREAAAGYRDYWFGAVGLSLVAVAFTDVDRYVLSQVMALEMLAQFHIGARILRLANRFLAVPVLAFQPEVTRLDAEGRRKSIEASTRVFLKFIVAVATAAALALWALAPGVVRLISSAQYDAAVPLLRILVLSMPLTAMTAPLTSVMKALDQVRRALYCDLAWAVVYIVLLVTLGGSYGLVGAGIAQVSASFVQLVVALLWSRRVVRAGFVVAAAGKTVVSGLVAFAPLLAAGALLPWSPVGTAAKLVLFAAALVLFRKMARITRVFDVQERSALVSILDRGRVGGVFRRFV
jgi:O-antigen/teichoic acid export membrane protein